MTDLADQIAMEIADVEVYEDKTMRQHKEIERITPIIRRHRAKRDAEVRIILGLVEYALDPAPKWTDDWYPPMTQAEILNAVRKALALLTKEAK